MIANPEDMFSGDEAQMAHCQKRSGEEQCLVCGERSLILLSKVTGSNNGAILSVSEQFEIP